MIITLIILLIAAIAHKKIFGNRFSADPLIKNFTPEEFNINTIPLEIKTKKNTLRGYIYNHDKHTENNIIVFGHGMWSDINSYTQDICYYAKKGYEVIAVNYAGVSSSDGKNIQGFGGSIKSLDEVLTYIENCPDYKNRDIYLIGHSWGAYGVLNAIYFHPNVKKVVAISPFITPTRLLKGFLPKPLYILIPFFLFVDKIKMGKYSNKKVYYSLEEYTGKTLILHSTDDNMVNFSNNTEYLMNLMPNLNYSIYENKGHNPNYSDNAVKCMNNFNTTLKNLPNDEKEAYKKQANYQEMGELDEKVMNFIIHFLKA